MIYELQHGIKIQSYSNGSYAFLQSNGRWRNIPHELGELLVKKLR